MTVFLVEFDCGEYGRPVAFFSTREAAERYAVEYRKTLKHGGTVNVQEWTVDDPKDLDAVAVRTWAVNIFARSGKLNFADEGFNLYSGDEPSDGPRLSVVPDCTDELTFAFIGWSTVSEADAIQAALDRRSAWMTANAQRMWDDPDCRNWAGFVPPA
ncbi:MAG: hypothetical protein H0W42_11470 [Gemmatimonadaceae bacterium]|nr:hypothetical protein [Gemmatimonadaceae bacterium]